MLKAILPESQEYIMDYGIDNLIEIDIKPSTFKTSILPRDIKYWENIQLFVRVRKIIGDSDSNNLVIFFVKKSQKLSYWTGLVYDIQVSISNKSFSNLIRMGFLSEKQINDGWVYELTHFAIESIYVEQSTSMFLYLNLEIDDLAKRVAALQELCTLTLRNTRNPTNQHFLPMEDIK